MKIKFNQDVETEIVVGFDEATEEVQTESETFKAGEVHDVDVCDVKGDKVDLQFGSGDMWYGAPLNLFAILEGQSELDEMRRMAEDVANEVQS